METIVIKTKNKADVKFWLEMAKRLGDKAKHLSDEEKEDLALGELLKETDRTKKVSRAKVMAKLGRK